MNTILELTDRQNHELDFQTMKEYVNNAINGGRSPYDYYQACELQKAIYDVEMTQKLTTHMATAIGYISSNGHPVFDDAQMNTLRIAFTDRDLPYKVKNELTEYEFKSGMMMPKSNIEMRNLLAASRNKQPELKYWASEEIDKLDGTESMTQPSRQAQDRTNPVL